MSTHTVCVGPDGHFWESHGEPIWTRIPRLPGETDMDGIARILGQPEDRLARVYFSIPMYWVKEDGDEPAWTDIHSSGSMSWDAINLPTQEPS